MAKQTVLKRLFTVKPITKIDRKKNKVKPLSLNELKLLLDNCNEQYKIIYSIAGFMGLRLTEILYIKVEDFDFKSKILNYRVAKSDEVTYRFIPEQVFKIINDWVYNSGLKGDDYLFKVLKGKYKGNRLNEKTVSKRTQALFCKLGICRAVKQRCVKSCLNPVKNALIHDKTFHSLRHTFGTEVWDICHNDEITAKTLRHKDGNCETVKVYREIVIQKQELDFSEEIIKKTATT